MTIDRTLLDLMTETVTWSTDTTLNSYGVPSWSTSGTQMLARIVYKHEQVRDKSGAVREARGTAWCAQNSTHVITHVLPRVDGRITLPDGTTPPVLTAETFYDEQGIHHHKIVFGY